MAEVRFGDVVYRNGQGFSEIAPSKEEVVKKTFKRTRGGSSSSGSSSKNLPQSNLTNETSAATKPIDPAGAYEVTVEGQGYSMRGVEVNKLIAERQEQERQQELRIKNENIRNTFNRLTPKTYVNKKVVEIDKGSGIPITEIKAYDDTSIGKFRYYKERDATTEEEKAYRDYNKNLIASTEQAPGFIGKARESLTYKYEQIKDDEFISSDFVDKISDKISSAAYKLNVGENVLRFSGVGGSAVSGVLQLTGKQEEFNIKTSKFIGGSVAGYIPETKGEFIKDAVTLGAGYVAGAGLRITEAAVVQGSIKVAEKFPKASRVISKLPLGYKIAEVGVGAGLTGAYAYSEGSEIYNERDYTKKGEITAELIKEVGLVGAGFSGGGRLGEKVIGKISTRGIKTDIPVEELIPKEVLSGEKRFPEAPVKEQLSLFLKNQEKFKLLGEDKAGGFHASPSRWWNKDFTASAGTSELPGTYFGSFVSPNFLKLSGSSSSYIPKSLKDLGLLFQARGVPRVAYNVPEGFRYTGFRKVPKYKIGEQEFKYKFKKESKPGYLDLPGMKTEIEAIARVDAGGYVATGKKAKFNINGIDVGIDVFKYEKLTTKPSRVSRGGSSKYNPLKYSEPVSIPRYTPTSLGVTGLRSSSISSRTSRYKSYSSKSRSSIRSSLSRISSAISSAVSYRSIPRSSRRSSSRSSLSRSSSRRSSYSSAPYIPKITIPKINLGLGKNKKKKKKSRQSDIVIKAEDFTTRALRGVRL